MERSYINTVQSTWADAVYYFSIVAKIIIVCLLQIPFGSLVADDRVPNRDPYFWAVQYYRMSHSIAPSLLAADFLHLEDQINLINQSEADYLHLDVMDGRFVPNISFGQALMPFIYKASEKPLDVHLMIEEPEKYVEQFSELGASIVTVHLEATRHLHRLIGQIKESDALAGVALNPHTSVDLLDDVLEYVDLICLMSVNPGFGGQKFIYQTLQKLKKLKAKLIERNLSPQIEIDGGVGLQNARVLIEAGADILVAGSSVFKSEDPITTISRLQSLA